MPFVISYFPYEVTIGSIKIPKKKYTEEEMQAGKRNIIEVSDENLALLNKDGYFAELLNQKKYRVTNNMPSEYRKDSEKVTELKGVVSDKDKEITELQKRIAELEKGKENNAEEKNSFFNKGRR